MDGAPPASPPTPDSQGADGGFNSSDVRGYLLWGLSFGVASAIAQRTINALTSSKREKPKDKEKGEEEKTTTTCNVVFPSVTTIINFKDSSETSQSGEDSTVAAASIINSKDSSETSQSGKDSTVAAASNGGFLGGLFSRPQAKAQLPPICKHALDFYYDCLHVSSEKQCEGYINLTEKCHQMGPTSAGISNISADPQNPTLRPPAALLHMSYHGCRKKHYDGVRPCKKYITYISETSDRNS